MKREDVVVLIDPFGGNLPCNDFAEYAVGIVHEPEILQKFGDVTVCTS
jgi:hypothetical protein